MNKLLLFMWENSIEFFAERLKLFKKTLWFLLFGFFLKTFIFLHDYFVFYRVSKQFCSVLGFCFLFYF